ncbi:hypothetical protein LX70_01225 [Defluviimonas denitrificans]|jgi:hypothetical protein|uniref:HTH-like domain-containing protein n=1 Tax=Albidovulum denitrificans TaxID=404881 RepID=A0A2S8S9B5_9RHOB|nr:hypothetical protein [Defluviimonas denitrificans]PQV57421.1 hypothetical protein LX70_01225 [Defluviimonas denitrificans]
MTEQQLADLLRKAYDSAPYRKKHAFVVLFGVTHAEELKAHSIASICERSGIGKWGPQVAMGVQLAEYVSLK